MTDITKLLDQATNLVNRSRTWEAGTAHDNQPPKPREVSTPVERVLRRQADLMEALVLVQLAALMLEDEDA